jgi:hypothetical protein
LKDKTDLIVKIRDPKTLQVLVQLKNPKVPICGKRQRGQPVIDLPKNIANNEKPHFGYANTQKCKTSGWECLAAMIKQKHHHKTFWEFVERLKSLRYMFNDILDKKLKSLPRRLRLKDEIIEMFVDMKKKIAVTEEKLNQEELE